MSNPLNPEQLQALLPPLPLDEPVLELESSKSRHRRAFVLPSGEIETDLFSEPRKFTVLSVDELIGKNIQRIRGTKSGSRWTAAATTRMLRYLTDNRLFRSDDVVSKIERGLRPVTAEELVWFCLLFEVPIWELLAPQSDQGVDIAGDPVGRDDFLRTITRRNPGRLEASPSADHATTRAASKSQRQEAEPKALTKLRDDEFDEFMEQARQDDSKESPGHDDAADAEAPKFGIWEDGWADEPGRVVRVEHSSELVRDASSERNKESTEELRRIIRETLTEMGYFGDQELENQ